MEAVVASFTVAGSRIAPLCHLDDVASFFIAAAAHGAGTIDRAAKVAAHIGTLAESVPLIGTLLNLLPSMPAVQTLLRLLPPRAGMTLLTDRTTCIVCEKLLDVVSRKDSASIQVPLFSQSGVISSVHLCKKTCRGCSAVHFPSYATGGTQLAAGEQRPYEGCTDARYFHITTTAVWETSLLVDLEVQTVHSHTGFLTFMKEYRMKHLWLPLSMERVRKVLSHAFYAWTFLRWREELGLPLAPYRLGDAECRDGQLSLLDQTLLAARPELQGAFTTYWGAQHGNHCRDPARCICHAVDGHVKARRPVCENRWARIVKCGSLGNIVRHCPHAPLPGSKYCRDCREAAAKGPNLLVGIGGTREQTTCPNKPAPAAFSFAHAPHVHSAACEHAVDGGDDEQAPSAAAAYRIERAASRGWEVSAAEKDVFLVETILEHKPATIEGQCKPTCSLGAGHGACVRTKKRQMFKIKWVGYDESYNSWVCENDVGQTAIREYNEERKAAAEARQAARRQNHAGSLAAALKAAAGGGTSDFAMKASDEVAFRELCKNNLKEFQYAEKKHTTAGILALVSGCGLFLKLDEIFGAESITQLQFFLFEAYHKEGIVKPKVLVYDDACHLKKFLLNRPDSVLCRTLLRSYEIVCDRFHFPNHVSAWCKANVDPAKCTVPGFSKGNTQAAEEAFAWLAGSKKIFRHMNEARFLFLMLRLAHLRNKDLCLAGMSPDESD